MSAIEQISPTEITYVNGVLDKAQQCFPEALEPARLLFREGFGKPRTTTKTERDYVTETDTAIEKTLIDWVNRRFPRHATYGEEGKGQAIDSANIPEWLWSFDPIDGTTCFFNGNPSCSIVASLRYRGVPTLSIVDAPMLNEQYVARLDAGAQRNNERVYPTAQTQLDKTILSTTYLFTMKRMEEMVGGVWDKVGGVQMRYSSLLEVCDVVSGRTGLGVWYGLGPHEWPAAYLLAREAGCVIGTLEDPNQPIALAGGGERNMLIAGNQHLYDQVKQLIALPSSLQ